jgi:ceramide glucosyltransferase
MSQILSIQQMHGHAFFHQVTSALALLASLASLVYLGFAAFYTRAFGRSQRLSPSDGPPVTILKPLCGNKPFLYENLRSFCDQDYPMFQVIFGVRDAKDPAIAVIKRVMRDFPDRDLALVIDDRVVGRNYKVGNLVNMYDAVKHDLVVIADSDMCVERTYLAKVVEPFAAPEVGIVTCLYSGQPRAGIWSMLGAMFLNEWFIPSVLVARAWEGGSYCFGSTMAVRREVLQAIGGFQALASYLADDYMLGSLVNACGLSVRLSTYVVENIISEFSLKSLFYHELRWARTVRSLRPVGHSLMFVTYALPISLLYLVVSSFGAKGMAVFVAALAMRLAIHYAARRSLGLSGRATPWLVPVRDALCFVVWGMSFFGRTVRWRGQELSVRPGGRLRMEPEYPR